MVRKAIYLLLCLLVLCWLSLTLACAANSAPASEWHPIATTMPENGAVVTIGCRSLGGTYFEGIIGNLAAGTPMMVSNGKSWMKEDYYV